jgi:hypothetical protein
MKLKDVGEIHVTWIENEEFYLYENLPATVSASADNSSLRFKLRELHCDEDDFEMIIHEKEDGTYSFRSDNYGEDDAHYPLDAYSSEDGFLFFFQDSNGHIFFRLR